MEVGERVWVERAGSQHWEWARQGEAEEERGRQVAGSDPELASCIGGDLQTNH